MSQKMASNALRMLMPALMLYRLIILIADYMDPRLVALRLKSAFTYTPLLECDSRVQ